MTAEQAQLFYDVKPHVDIVHQPLEDQMLMTSIKVRGDMSLAGKVLNPGEQVTISVSDADGEILASGVCEILSPSFGVLELDGNVVGMERKHTAKVTV